MTIDMIALGLAGLAILMSLPPAVWVYLWAVRR